MAAQTIDMVPTWYNRPLVDGMEDSRVSVAPSAEHEPMDNDDPLFPIRMAVPAYGWQIVQAACSPAQLRSRSAVALSPLQGTTSVAKHGQGRASASSIPDRNDAGEQ